MTPDCVFCPLLKKESPYTVQESQNTLRQLEHNALDAVLHAFRAQGPLDVYKEVLLDHLRTSLFISREDYIFKVDHVATNETLKNVCDTLNPSYSEIDANWLLERQSVLPSDFRLHMERLGRDVTDIFDSSTISEKDWNKMCEDDEVKKKQSLAKLLHLEKKPFTPEALRRILVSTEQAERIDDVEKEISIKCDSKSGTVDSEAQTDLYPFRFLETNGNHSKFFDYIDIRLNELVPFNQFMKQNFMSSRPVRKRRHSLSLQTRYKILRQQSM